MRYYSIFSGIEAASVAWGPLGWTPLLFSEVDECPDTPRYRATGNSMAVPVMRWIGERIAEADGK